MAEQVEFKAADPAAPLGEVARQPAPTQPQPLEELVALAVAKAKADQLAKDETAASHAAEHAATPAAEPTPAQAQQSAAATNAAKDSIPESEKAAQSAAVPVTTTTLGHVFAKDRPLDNISDDRKQAYELEAKKLTPQQLLDARKG